MDLRVILTFITVICFGNSKAQEICEYNHDYVWILGAADRDTITDEYGGSEINFNTEIPTIKRHPKLADSPWQNSCMSSKNGELLFYSNGCSVFNRVDVEMSNGDSLNPGEPYNLFCPDDGYSGTQNMISLPDLEDSTLYYIFHIDKYINPDPFAAFPVQSKHAYYTTISFDSAFPSGRVLNKNIVLLNDTSMLGSPVSAVKTGSGLGWWIITPNRWSNEFHIFRIQEETFEYIGSQAIGLITDPNATGGQGKFSPNGKMFAWFHPRNGLFLYDFDRVFGMLSNFRNLDINLDFSIIGGCEFSPSGQFLYINNHTELYQLDLFAKDIVSSLTLVGVYDGFNDPLPTQFFYMERTPDNRIFMNVVNGSKYLHVIHKPNSKGLECDFEQHAIELPTYNNLTFPHFPNYRLGSVTDSLCHDYLVNSSTVIPKTRESITIYPNPASDYITVSIQGNQLADNYSIIIYDLNGNAILVSKDQKIDVEYMPPGIYYCYITTSLFTQKLKLVIVK